jgi:hypothetical protein
VHSKVNRALAYDLIEQGIIAIEGGTEAFERAMNGALGRQVRLHHELDAGYQDPGVFETPTAPLTLLREFLESIQAVEPERDEWWVEPEVDGQVRLADAPATTRL